MENHEHDRCVDLFLRPDQSFGFEEFRRDVEDAGAWTPVRYYSVQAFGTVEDAYRAAEAAVPWFRDILAGAQHLRRGPE